MNTVFSAFKIASILCIGFASHGQTDAIEYSDWEQCFEEFSATGTIVVVDARQTPAITRVVNDKRAQVRFSPASTYKLPHTLFALDAGIIKDEFQVFPWDGTEHSYKPHNQDQTLRSAMRHSAIWVYESVAEQIGEDKARTYLEKINYGNADPSTDQGTYWVDGYLSISAYEQIAFLQSLFKNELPFRTEHQRLLKDVMIAEAGSDWILRAKTGWEGRYGWWVGWVEWPQGPVFFALNIDTPNRFDDLFKRKAIVQKILQSIEALPKRGD